MDNFLSSPPCSLIITLLLYISYRYSWYAKYAVRVCIYFFSVTLSERGMRYFPIPFLDCRQHLPPHLIIWKLYMKYMSEWKFWSAEWHLFSLQLHVINFISEFNAQLSAALTVDHYLTIISLLQLLATITTTTNPIHS